MKPFCAILAIAVALTSAEPQRQQRTRVGRQQGADRGYGAPDAAAPPPPVQATYGNSPPQQDSSSLSQAQDHDHSGLDWLLNSVPGQPGTDYPIYGQEALGNFAFECNGQIEGGYYADTASDCQAFHVCVPDAVGGLSTQSFLCPNGTIFNQEYFICDWWFNFDCAQAQDLYSRNDEIAAEREQLSQASASNINSYSEPAPSSYNQAAPASNSYSQNQNQQNYAGRN